MRRTVKGALLDCLAVISVIAACLICVAAHIDLCRGGLTVQNFTIGMIGFACLIPGYARLIR